MGAGVKLSPTPMDVPVEADAPPGVYWLDVGLYPTDQPALSLPLASEGQLLERNSVPLGPIKVGGPPPAVTPTPNPAPISGSGHVRRGNQAAWF